MNAKFMQVAIDEAKKGLQESGQGPFGACIVKNDEVIAVGNNHVVAHNDPTSHAEIVTIRRACEKLKHFELKGCEIYSTSEPCPMCFGAIYWCRLDKMYYGCTRHEAAEIGFDDQLIYDELEKEIGKNVLSSGNSVFLRYMRKNMSQLKATPGTTVITSGNPPTKVKTLPIKIAMIVPMIKSIRSSVLEDIFSASV